MSDNPDRMVGGFGELDGLGRRMNTWARQLSRDKRYPWVGLGLIADLKRAATELGAPSFEEMFPSSFSASPPPVAEEEDEFADFYAAKKAQEFDL